MDTFATDYYNIMEQAKEILIRLFDSPILYILSIIVLIFLLKKGLLQIDSGPIKLGRTRENERRILAAQISFINLRMDALSMEFIRKFPEISEFHTKYVLNKIGDELVRRCAVNHISDTDIYKEDVYMTLVDMTRKRANHQYYWSSEFEAFVKEQVDNIIKHLIEIRQRMSK